MTYRTNGELISNFMSFVNILMGAPGAKLALSRLTPARACLHFMLLVRLPVPGELYNELTHLTPVA